MNREDVKAAQSKTPPLTRVDLDALAATIRHFRSADAAMFGCRRGAYAHSAAGALAHALDGYRAVLASCPAATADSTDLRPDQIDQLPEIVHPSSSSSSWVIPVTEAAARGGGVKGRGGFEPGGGAGFVGVVSASCVLAVGGVAFCVARYLQTRRDRSVRGPWRKMDDAGDDLGRPPRVPPSGSRSRRPRSVRVLRQDGSTGTFRRVAWATSRSSRTWTARPEFPPNPRATIASARPRWRWATSWTCRARGTTDAATPSPSPPRGRPPRLRPTIWSSGVSPGASASRSPGTRRGTPPRTTACGAWGSSG